MGAEAAVMLVSTRNLVPQPETMYFYIPIFANSTSVWETALANVFSSFLALELFLIFIGAVINGSMIVALYNSSLIHPNLKAIWIAHLVEYFFFAIGQSALVCHQVGLFPTTDFWLVMAGTAKLHFMWATLLVQTVTIIERCIATMCIKNYEMFHNRAVAAILGTAKSLGAFLISLSISLIIVKYAMAAILVTAIVLSTSTLYIILLAYNRHLLASTSLNMYTLSSKYQVTENIRILTLVRNIFILITLECVFVTAIMGVLRIWDHSMDFLPFPAVLADMVIAGFPIEVYFLAMWDYKSRGRLSREERMADPALIYAKESLIYFKQLNSSWSKRGTSSLKR